METSGVVTIKELAYWDSVALNGSTIPSPSSHIDKLSNSLIKSLYCGSSVAKDTKEGGINKMIR